MAWYNHSNAQCNLANEQYSIIPRALCDEDGNPYKSNKSNWSDKLANRYESTDPPVFTSHLPCDPQIVIIDAMFINTRPLRQTKAIAEYFKLLFNQFLLPHYKSEVSEVHFQDFNPKQFGHHKQTQKSAINEHKHIGWQGYLECRKCKRSIVKAISLSVIQHL